MNRQLTAPPYVNKQRISKYHIKTKYVLKQGSK